MGFAHRAFLELYPGRPFEANWHIDVLAEKLEAVRRGKSKRLIINVPPRSLKSFLGSIAFPAFVLGHSPSSEILCTSYGQDFANDLALPCRMLMLSPFYQALFGTRLSDDRQAVEEFKTTAGGARRAVSWTGAMMGRGADFIIIDDPLKVEEALSESRRAAVNDSYHTSVSTRLNRDTGAIILIMQRLALSWREQEAAFFAKHNGALKIGDVRGNFPCYLKFFPCYRVARSLFLPARFRARKSRKGPWNRGF
ncbi:MAG: hypothetical protein WDM81_03050 [Rhizomicrobium sp.]